MPFVQIDDVLKTLLLLFNVLLHAAFQILFNAGNRQRSILAICIYGMLAVIDVILTVGILAIVIKYRHKLFHGISKKQHVCLISCRIILMELMCLYYFCGNNLSNYIQIFGSGLGCNDDCFGKVNFVSTVILMHGIAGFTVVSEYTEKMKLIVAIRYKKTSWSFWKAALHCTAILIEFDSWYTPAVNFLFNSSCPQFELSWIWIFFGTLNLAWIVFLFLSFFPAILFIKKHRNCRKAITIVVMTTMLVSFEAFYILVDNSQPVACILGCNDFDFECYGGLYSIFRLTFLFLFSVILTMLLTIRLVIFSKEVNHRKK